MKYFNFFFKEKVVTVRNHNSGKVVKVSQLRAKGHGDVRATEDVQQTTDDKESFCRYKNVQFQCILQQSRENII